MTLEPRIIDFLQQRRSVSYCDDCLAEVLSEDSKAVEAITERLRKKDLSFLGGGYVCDHCGVIKPATTFALPSTP